MKRKQRWLLIFISFILSSVIIYGLYLFQAHYIRAEQTVTVYVANKWLQTGHIVTPSDIKTVMFPRSIVTDEMIVEMNQLLNKELIMPLGQDEPFLVWKLNDFHLLPKHDEATFQIPVQYIKSVANDLRAGDYVSLYLSQEDGVSLKLFEKPIKVASVKTSTNVEVESITGNDVSLLLQSNEAALYQQRRKATGMIEYINLNLTEQQWLAIDEACKTGQAELIIAYSPLYVE